MRFHFLAPLFRRAMLALMVIAIAACSSLETDPTAKWDAERLYKEAREEQDTNNWARARELLEKLEARYPFGRYAQQAQLEIAYTYYKEGEWAQAIAACDRFLKLNPNHPNADYVHYLKGRSSFNDDLGLFGRLLGVDPTARDPKSMRDAFDAYRELVTRFPNSRYAPEARQRMNFLINALAQAEVNVARYYYERSAYLAAIQRAQSSLKEFSGAPASEEALGIMLQSYQALGMNDLRADTKRVLEKNFPNSRYLRDR